jgi:predicted amidohydrolase
MTSTDDVERNLALTERLVRGAAAAGADLIALPENFSYLRYEGSKNSFRTPVDGPVVRSMQRLARELRIYLLLGSIPEQLRGTRRIANTSVLIGRDGRTVASYRKLHLFDIDIRGGVVLKESSVVRAGDEIVVADTDLGRLGLSICYDLRFPELYRQLAFAGAEVLFVPSAFTAYTGPHHWLPLLRARAIENQCWVVAPAQVGRHNEKRESHGETVVIDPWGTVVERRPRARGWALAEIDLAAVARVRRGLPALNHVRRELFRAPSLRRGHPGRVGRGRSSR